jgi:hypothetical protein
MEIKNDIVNQRVYNLLMSEFDIPQDSHEWAEKKHLLRFCDVHKTHFDPNIGCKDCKTDSLPIQQITNEGYSPFRAVKQGYKHHAGSYWKLLTPFDIDSAGGITLTDTKGTWVKVSIEANTKYYPTKTNTAQRNANTEHRNT